MDFLYHLLSPIFFCCPLYGGATSQTETKPATLTFKYKHISPKK